MLSERNQAKKSASCLISLMYSRKYKLIYSDRKQISDCLWEEKGLSGEMTKDLEENWGNDGYFHYFDCSEFHECIRMSNLIKISL